MEPLKHRSISSSGRSLPDLVHWVSVGDVDLNPPYQRGDVWTPQQRVNLMKSILMGIPIAALVINKRGDNAAWEKASGPVQASEPYYACIDGKQRLTTALMWLRSELAIPRWWLEDRCLDPDQRADEVYYEDLTPQGQRYFKNVAILPVAEAKLRDIAEEAEVYDLINSAGTAHSEGDLIIARQMKDAR